MRVKKLVKREMVKSKKTGASNPSAKGNKKQADREDPYAAEM